MEFVAFRSIFRQERFNLSVFNHLERFGVEQLPEIVFGVGAWVFYGKQSVVEAHFGIFAVTRRNPVERAFHLAIGAFHPAKGVGVVGALNFGDIAVGVFAATGAHHDVGTLESHFLARSHAEEFLWRIFHKVVALNVDFLAERHFVGAGIFLLGIVVHIHHFHLVGGIVGDDHLHGIEHGAHAVGALIEVVANGVFKEADIVERFKFGVADGVDKILDGFRGEATSAQAANGGHTRVVPSVHQVFLHQLQQFALAHHGVGEVQAVEFYLARAVLVGSVACQFFHEFFVKRTVRHKFEGANGVGHALKVVALPMGKVVHGIHLPLVAGAPMRLQNDAIHNGVAEVHIIACHIYFGTEHTTSFGKFACIHAGEKVEVFFHGAVAERTFLTRSGGRTFLGGNLFAALVVYISLSLLN